MAFALKQHEKVGHSFHRIGGRQLSKAGQVLTGAEDPNDALHDVRKATKRVRALLRVFRPGIKDARFRELNTLVRDAAQSLSAGRDAQALVVTFDALVARDGFVGERDVRAELVRRAEHAGAAVQDDPALVTQAAEGLAAAGRVLDGTAVHGNRRTLRTGVHDIYRAARRAHGRCTTADDDDDELWHDWRKRTKYLWHAVQLVEPAAPAILHAHTRELHHLADALGDDHDLAVLRSLVHEHGFAFGSEPVRERLFEVIGRARHELHERALASGARLLVERPDAYADRVMATVDVWHAQGEGRPVGGLADLDHRDHNDEHPHGD